MLIGEAFWPTHKHMLDEQTIVYIDEHAFHYQLPITQVVHDLEPQSLLLFSENGRAEEWVTTSFADACKLEPGIRELRDLPLGWHAQRVGNSWRRAPLHSRTHRQLHGLLVVAAISAIATLFIAWQNGFPPHMLIVALVGIGTGAITLALLYVLFRRRWHAAAGWFGEDQAQQMWQQTATESQQIRWQLGGGVLLLFIGLFPALPLRLLNIPTTHDDLGLVMLAWIIGFFASVWWLWNWLIQQRDARMARGDR